MTTFFISIFGIYALDGKKFFTSNL